MPTTLKLGPWEWTEWPTMPMPTAAFIKAMAESKGPSAVNDFHEKREQSIAREQHDPLVYGWEQPPLKEIIRPLLAGTYVPGRFGTATPAGLKWKQELPANDIVGLGGNGSGKSEVQAKIAMEQLVSKPRIEARMFSQNEGTSTRQIQRPVYKYLPPSLRNIKSRGVTLKISYKEATGFSEGIFVLQNHSTCVFPTYKGWEQDPNSVEGGECFVLTWDEECPAALIDTLRFRVHKTGGFILGGFTPLKGFTATVAQYTQAGVILETIPARTVVWDWWKRTWTWGDWILPKDRELVKGCPPGHVPLVIQSAFGNGQRFAVILPTFFNPYTNGKAILASCQGKPVDFYLERLWGWATQRVRMAFSAFCEHHMVDPERVPALSDMTLYKFADPHGARNWFTLWIGVDRDGNKYVFDEWPGEGMGEWALPSDKPDGKVGPGQTEGSGKCFNDYKRIFLEKEGWRANADGILERTPDTWDIYDNRMDPRPAGTSVPSDSEARTYLEYMAEPVMDSSGRVLMPGIDFLPAPTCGIEDGIQLINNWLTAGWDPKQPVTPLNCPKLYISRKCKNLIYALSTYTGLDGEKGACKDPIDCLKGAAKLDICWVDKTITSTGPRGSY